jgi:hypothetical protein
MKVRPGFPGVRTSQRVQGFNTQFFRDSERLLRLMPQYQQERLVPGRSRYLQANGKTFLMDSIRYRQSRPSE